MKELRERLTEYKNYLYLLNLIVSWVNIYIASIL